MTGRASTAAWLFIFAAIFILYLPSLHGPFILDDSHTIQNNIAVRDISQLGKIWTSARYYSSSADNWGYRPVTTVSSTISWWIGGGATWPFHLFKIIIFCGVCFLLSQIWRRLLPTISQPTLLMGILLFAVNPVHTQVVSYISATSTLLAGFFVCAALLSYLKYRESHLLRWLIAMAAAIVLSVLSKEEGIVVIAIIPMVEIYLRKISGQLIFKSLPWLPLTLAVLAGVLAVSLVFIMFEPSSNVARGTVTRLNYFMTQWRAYLYYMFMYVLPVSLNADNLEFAFVQKFSEPRVLWALVGNIFVLAVAAWAWRKQPIVTVAVIWFYAGVSPSSSFIPLAEPVNDHRSFIAYFGLGMIGLLLLEMLNKRHRTAFLTLTTIMLCAYSVGTFQRNKIWASNEALWSDTVVKNPSSPRALNNLAVDLMGKARYEEAAALLEKCHTVGYAYGLCFVNHAVIESTLGHDQRAEELFNIGETLYVSRISALTFSAAFLKSRGLFSQAYAKLVEVDKHNGGRNYQVRRDMIDIAIQLGDHALARKLFEESRKEFGDYSDLISLGNQIR